jgi:hypothetical protein
MKEITDFIQNNKLSFSGKGSELNSNMVTISGFALHKGIQSSDELSQILDLNDNSKKLLGKVFEAAKMRKYEKYWETETAKKMYKF